MELSFGTKREMRFPDQFQSIVLFESFQMPPLGLFRLWVQSNYAFNTHGHFQDTIISKHGLHDLSLVRENIHWKIK